MSVVKKGVVKMVGPSFGFLTADDDSGDAFIHISVIEKSGLAIEKGDSVVYTIEPNPRGPRAISIAYAD
jgi:CspA family cold shock protein